MFVRPVYGPSTDTINGARRRKAKEEGIRFYLPCNPCHYGHDSPRYTSDGHCVECRRLYNARLAEEKKANEW